MQNINLYPARRGWLLLAVALLCAFHANAAITDYRWYGGGIDPLTNLPSDNWDVLSNWRQWDGNISQWVAVAAVPNFETDVEFTFDNSSTNTVNINTVAHCHDFDCSNAPASLTITGSGSEMSIFGDVRLKSGMTFTYAGLILLKYTPD